jgi:hypothetical protein
MVRFAAGLMKMQALGKDAAKCGNLLSTNCILTARESGPSRTRMIAGVLNRLVLPPLNHCSHGVSACTSRVMGVLRRGGTKDFLQSGFTGFRALGAGNIAALGRLEQQFELMLKDGAAALDRRAA